MELDDSVLGFLTGVFAGHVPVPSQATVNPVDVLLTHPSRVAAPSDGSPQNVVANHDAGYSAMANLPQETLQYHPPWPASHPRCPYFQFSHDAVTTPSTGAVRPGRPRFRGARVDNAVPKPCQWQPQGSPICGQEITGPSVPTHLAGHGIQNMGRECMAQCCWSECGALIKRHGMTRHLREVHLGLKRKSYAVADAPV